MSSISVSTLEGLATIVSNAAFAIPLRFAWKRRGAMPDIIGWISTCMFVSIVYHFGEGLGLSWLETEDLRRFDYTFACTAMAVVIAHAMGLPSWARIVLANGVFLGFSMLLWSKYLPATTEARLGIIAYVGGAGLGLASLYVVKYGLLKYHLLTLARGVGLGVMGLTAWGIEAAAPLEAYSVIHSWWHFLIAVSGYYMLKAPVEETRHKFASA